MTDLLHIHRESLIQKGAEAYLYEGKWFGKRAIFKQRVQKGYRINEIDDQIRSSRTLNEARALIKVKEYGINVPQVFEIDFPHSTIVMKQILGTKLKDLLNSLDLKHVGEILFNLGVMIAILHKNGHIHGDITTSNVIITKDYQIFLIDFGLHQYSETVEDKSVDIHLFKRVLISSHGSIFNDCFKSFLKGYRSGYDREHEKDCEMVIKNIKLIESRGRYVKQEDRI
jgi:Kae1-associated kinase Bud32